MTVHLIKLSVGPTELADLANWQSRRLEEQVRNGEKPELMHITKHMPKRAAEVLDGGSIYWIIKGWLCARQKVIELRPLELDGIRYCGLVFDRELVRVSPRQHRPFQGWRYFSQKDIPADLIKGNIDYDMPEEMLRELTLLGMI